MYYNNTAYHIDDGRKAFRWGAYRLENDTIKAYCVDYPGAMGINYSEYWFKIINEKEIMYIRPNKPQTEKFQKENIELHMNFYPLNNIPNPNKDAWIKRKKWFWCDETEYKKWMAEHGNKKK